MKEFQEMHLSWESNNEPKWLIDISEIQKEKQNNANSSKLNLNVSIVRRKTNFDNAIDKFLTILGLSLATTTNHQKIVVGVILATILCPLKISFFKNNKTKKVFDLIESEFGDYFIKKEVINKSEDEDFKKIILALKRKNYIEEEDDKYFFNQIILTSFNLW